MADKRNKSGAKIYRRRDLVIGLFMIVLSFGCVVAVFYFMTGQQMEKTAVIEILEEQMELLNMEKTLAQQKAEQLEDASGRAIDLNKLFDVSQQLYGAEESRRQEGYLWLDRTTQTSVVNLGALNGLEKGGLLTVYDGEEKLGFVRVTVLLDVISYVRMVNIDLNDLKNDYYRVSILKNE